METIHNMYTSTSMRCRDYVSFDNNEVSQSAHNNLCQGALILPHLECLCSIMSATNLCSLAVIKLLTLKCIFVGRTQTKQRTSLPDGWDRSSISLGAGAFVPDSAHPLAKLYTPFFAQPQRSNNPLASFLLPSVHRSSLVLFLRSVKSCFRRHG